MRPSTHSSIPRRRFLRVAIAAGAVIALAPLSPVAGVTAAPASPPMPPLRALPPIRWSHRVWATITPDEPFTEEEERLIVAGTASATAAAGPGYLLAYGWGRVHVSSPGRDWGEASEVLPRVIAEVGLPHLLGRHFAYELRVSERRTPIYDAIERGGRDG